MNSPIRIAAFALLAVAAWIAPSRAASAGPDERLALVNAKVWTGDAARPWAEGLIISGDTIELVGSSAEVRKAAGDARIADLGGKTVVPGFIDSHVHFVDGGFRLASVQLRDAASRDVFVARIAAHAKTLPAGAWVTGGDWDHSLWGGELPTRGWIDAVTPDRPVWINRLDGHMALANSAALKAAGVTRDSPDIAGGTIVRDADGEPTGVLKDNAMALVDKVAPPPSPALRDRALAAAMAYVNARGVTSIHHMGTWDDLDTFARAAKKQALTTRIYAAVPLSDWQRLADTVRERRYGGADGRGDAWLRIGMLKGFMDGSLGSHTAAMLAPFSDTPSDSGLLLNPPGQMRTWIAGADKAGLHVAVHAIGDRAIRMLLDDFAAVAAKHGARDRRFRMEHVQHPAAADIPRLAKLGVIASMQPYHAIDDGRWAEQFIGKRIETTYAFRDLLDAHATLAFGSDWFVAPPTPLEGIYAAVTRRTLDDRNPGGWVPAQKITVEEALRAYTVGAAFASFEESRKGSLAAGKLADLVVLGDDLFEVAPERIRDIKVEATLVGGRVVSGALPD